MASVLAISTVARRQHRTLAMASRRAEPFPLELMTIVLDTDAAVFLPRLVDCVPRYSSDFQSRHCYWRPNVNDDVTITCRQVAERELPNFVYTPDKWLCASRLLTSSSSSPSPTPSADNAQDKLLIVLRRFHEELLQDEQVFLKIRHKPWTWHHLWHDMKRQEDKTRRERKQLLSREPHIAYELWRQLRFRLNNQANGRTEVKKNSAASTMQTWGLRVMASCDT